jgi:GrpB-like predicted nucleotidyltransferase (UPF0157 family)
MEPHGDKLSRVLNERVEVVPYDPVWPTMFQAERRRLSACLPSGIVDHIEHFGSTAVPGLDAKPVIDMLIGVRSLDETRRTVVPILEAQGYDYFWRPTHGDDTPPWYAWFIRRDAAGRRTHHLHMVETGPDFTGHWDRLLFRDFLILRPDLAREYAALKRSLSHDGLDRVDYTRAKHGFIANVTEEARLFFGK